MNKIDQLKEYDEKYYNTGTSPISDTEYDILKDEARDELPIDPYFDTVGYTVPGDKVKLPYVLGSLDKIKTDSLDKWLNEHPGEICISHKLDGVSSQVDYKNSKVIFSSTRGNGYEGKDITDKAKIFCSKVNTNNLLVVRGEALLLGNDHIKLGFKNKRNGVAGILNRDGINNCDKIVPYFYELINSYPYVPDTEIERFEKMESIGLKVPRYKLLDRNNALDDLIDMLNEDTKYETDGIVLAVNVSERENVYYPENKVAFKINIDVRDAVVVDEEWNTGRTGRVTPVLIIEPVEIDGVTITRCSGFNADFIVSNNISKGTKMEIVRSGGVIPYIVKVHKDTKDPKIVLPSKCPSCNGPLIRKEVELICTNLECPSQSYKKVEHFLKTMGTENITIKTLEKLDVDTIQKAYELDEYEISNINGFGIKRGVQITNEIQKTLKCKPENLLAAFGIPELGRTLSPILIEKFETLDNVLNATENELERCDGVGPKTSKYITEKSGECKKIYKYLQEKGLKFVKEESEPLKGLIFTLTGSYEIKRDILTKRIINKGGMVKGISKSTSFLVTNDLDSTSGKMKKAEKYNITIIPYEKLMDMLEED